MSTTKTVGQVKVDALKERLLTINPSAEKPIDPDGKGNGSIVHITAIFGFMLAGLVIQNAVSVKS
jgi:tRNA A37 threonylcarbamoyladenosine dehydratase